MKLLSLVVTGAAALALLGGSGAMAAPVVSGPSVPVNAGSTAVFTVSDLNPADGVDGGMYQASFHFDYDAAALRYLGTDTLLPAVDWLVVAPDLSLGDADPAGHFDAAVFSSIDPAATSLELFTLRFLALTPTPAGPARVSLSFANGSGAVYGSSSQDAFPATSAPVTVNSAVPEPASASIVALALAGLGLSRRRSGRPTS